MLAFYFYVTAFFIEIPEFHVQESNSQYANTTINVVEQVMQLLFQNDNKGVFILTLRFRKS